MKKRRLRDIHLGTYLDTPYENLEPDVFLCIFGEEEEQLRYYGDAINDCQMCLTEYLEDVYGHVFEVIARELGTSEEGVVGKEATRIASLVYDAWKNQ